MERTNQGTICVFVDVYLVYVVAIHWGIPVWGPEAPPPPPLFSDQTEAQMVETIFFFWTPGLPGIYLCQIA